MIDNKREAIIIMQWILFLHWIAIIIFGAVICSLSLDLTALETCARDHGWTLVR